MRGMFTRAIAVIMAIIMLSEQIFMNTVYADNTGIKIEKMIEACESATLDGSKPAVNNTGAIISLKYTTNDKYRRDGLIQFNLDKAYSEIKKAELKFFISKADNKGKSQDINVNVYGFLSDWNVQNVTWNNKPDLSNEQKIDSNEIVKVSDWYTVDVTDFFNANAGVGKISFRLEGEHTYQTYMNISSATHPSQKPQLVLYKEDSNTGVIPPNTANNDSEPDIDASVIIDRKLYFPDRDEFLKTFYVNEKAGDKQRAKTKSLFVGGDFSAYFHTNTVKYPDAVSSFLRFYVEEDYKEEPIKIKIFGVAEASSLGETITFNNKAILEPNEIYTLSITNKGWYSIDVSDYVKTHQNYGFYMEKADVTSTKVVRISSFHSENAPVLYTTAQSDEFDFLRKNFSIKEMDYNGIAGEDISRMIDMIDTRADGIVSEFDATNEFVFEKLPLRNNIQKIIQINKCKGNPSKNITPEMEATKKAIDNARASYVKLNTLLNAYYTPNSKYHKDNTVYQKIKDGLTLLYKESYNPSLKENGNWWTWEIGVPKVLGEMIVTMYDELTPKERMDYLFSMYRFQPNPEKSHYNWNEDGKITPNEIYSVGANRIDTCIGDLLLGIASKNPNLVEASVAAIDPVFRYVKTGDGFYRDGSFIQHKDIAYTTGYGMVLVDGLTNLHSKLNRSRWEITNPDYNNVYEWLENAFIPMVYNGQSFPITGGRGISRQNKDKEWGQTFEDGYKIARLLYASAKNAPEDKRMKFLSLSRRFMDKNEFYNVKENARNISMLREYEDLRNVPMADSYIGSKVFSNMNRVVHHRKDYAVALAMYSKKIKNFEMMLNENVRGWNQGNGTLYLLNEDAGQYDDGFWPTVDPYKLAGTTVDNIQRTEVDHKEEFYNNSDFVGGVTLDHLYSVAAMDLREPLPNKPSDRLNYNTTLKAKKSWFFFDDEIVALGSGISANDGREVDTIVENRMLQKDNSNVFKVNGKEELANLSPVSTEIPNVSYAHLSGKKESATIGYYFPESVTLNGIRLKGNGTWKQIGKTGTDKLIERNYLKLWMAHGVNPTNEKYSYAILPGKTNEFMEEYAKNPKYEVKANDENVQAVYHKDLGIFAANIYNEAFGDLGKIKVDKPCSIMLKEDNKGYSFAISDTTMKSTAPINVVLDVNSKFEIGEHSNNVNVISENPLTLEISLVGDSGKTAYLKSKKKTENTNHDFGYYVPPVVDSTISVITEKEEIKKEEVKKEEIKEEEVKKEEVKKEEVKKEEVKKEERKKEVKSDKKTNIILKAKGSKNEASVKLSEKFILNLKGKKLTIKSKHGDIILPKSATLKLMKLKKGITIKLTKKGSKYSVKIKDGMKKEVRIGKFTVYVRAKKENKMYFVSNNGKPKKMDAKYKNGKLSIVLNKYYEFVVK